MEMLWSIHKRHTLMIDHLLSFLSFFESSTTSETRDFSILYENSKCSMLASLRNNFEFFDDSFRLDFPWHAAFTTVFENYPKCLIWIFQIRHFPSIFVLSKMTYLVALFNRKLQVFKWTIFVEWDFLNNFAQSCVPHWYAYEYHYLEGAAKVVD